MDPSDWLPTYPDQLRRRRSRLAPALASQPPYNFEVFPVPDVLASLTFLPVFPDRVPHLRVTREETGVMTAAQIATIVAPLGWLPIYPLTVPHRQLATGSIPTEAAPPLGVQVLIAQSLTWQPGWPTSVPHHRPLQPGGLTWVPSPTVAAADALCVDLALDTFAAPTLLGQALTTPTALAEGLGTSTFLDEDLCT